VGWGKHEVGLASLPQKRSSTRAPPLTLSLSSGSRAGWSWKILSQHRAASRREGGGRGMGWERCESNRGLLLEVYLLLATLYGITR